VVGEEVAEGLEVGGGIIILGLLTIVGFWAGFVGDVCV
jgi:hypothetical protein